MSAVADITLQEIVTKLRGIAPAIRAEGVTRLAIFGSRARGDASPNSDLDILIDVRPDATFGWKNLTEVIAICSDATGLVAQVTTQSELTPRVAERIADDLVEVI
jgi:uncharacterized protein